MRAGWSTHQSQFGESIRPQRHCPVRSWAEKWSALKSRSSVLRTLVSIGMKLPLQPSFYCTLYWATLWKWTLIIVNVMRNFLAIIKYAIEKIELDASRLCLLDFSYADIGSRPSDSETTGNPWLTNERSSAWWVLEHLVWETSDTLFSVS